MIIKFKKLWIISASFFCALQAHAQMDAKSYGMGGVGVSASDYMYAPLYNPALVANYNTYEKSGIVLPSYLYLLDDPDLTSTSSEMAYAEQSLYMAYALPDTILTQSFYFNVQEQNILSVDSSGSTTNSVESNTRINEFGYVVSWFTPLKYNATFYTGFNMKLQQVETTLSKTDFSSTSISTSVSDLWGVDTSDTDINLDFGVAYRISNITLGAVLKNIFTNEYTSNLSDGSQATYEISPQLTVSGTLDYTDMRFSLDYDFNEAGRIIHITDTDIDASLDDVQYIKFGYEYYLTKDYTVRLGFINDLAGDRTVQITTGLGVQLSKGINLDTSLSYFGASKYGAGVALQMAY